MVTTTIKDPDVHKQQQVGSDGVVYLTTDLAGKRVNVIAKVVDEQEGED